MLARPLVNSGRWSVVGLEATTDLCCGFDFQSNGLQIVRL
jgi:hypothetical protein